MKDKNRVTLSRCVGKLMAYMRVGNTEEAKVWAEKLVIHLREMGLYAPESKGPLNRS